MKAWLKKARAWARNKYGRITTFVGGVLASVQVFDLGIVKQPIADFVGDHWATKIVSAAALLCFGLSYLRHQQVANRVTKLKEDMAPDQVPPKDVPEK